MRFRRPSLAVALLAAALAAGPAAAVQRTFVASFGSDGNACSIISPCRGLAKALTLTDPFGEVVILDSAGYGGATITQSVSIIAPAGVYAGVSVFAGFDGIVINGAGAEVTLRGLTINGQGGNVGIRLLQGQSLTVENCTISNMDSDGIQLAAGNANVVVRDTQVRASIGRGIHITAGNVLLDRVRVERSDLENLRIRAEVANAQVHVRDSVFRLTGSADGISVTNTAGFQSHVTVERSSVLRSGSIGIFASGTAPGPISVTVVDSTVSEHQSSGIVFQGPDGSRMSVSGSTVSRNGGNSLLHNNTGTTSAFVSFQNNTLTGNAFGPNGITTQALQ